ncbi:Hypothetical protein I595_465 [Croceitalea dokdonensis DOKDO 023]|uniref:Uncharacterized protein n=1 Tax=Croceitalea dokdonensis DOKDO 023 TaxID=1300341 RepID=A0A0P7AXM5_9FLAO|nr:hypothetical protein [Croceitalea dokdonensis]KPM33562.1 Hypothetical protein I595_465 [Croceitalea dokdonensis DOKDO 023]
MTNKLLTLASIFVLLLSCDEEKVSVQPEIMSEEIDTTPPKVSIPNFEEVLGNSVEVATTIAVSIEEDSEIEEVSVLVNQSEILNTKEKVFSFELNPFNYPNGENILSIVAKDSENNRTQQNEVFEVNKLLVSIAAPTVPPESQLFFSVNTMNGDLLAFALVTRPLEIVKLYADDDFTPQPIIVTSYEMQPEAIFKANLNSIANIEPGTDLVAFQEAAGVNTENTFESNPIIQPFTIKINSIPNNVLANSFFVVSYNHLGQSTDVINSSEGLETQMRYDSLDTTIENTLIYTSSSIAEAKANNTIALEDYRYLLLENPKDTTLSFSEFKSPESTISFSVPSNSETFSQRLVGYKDSNGYLDNEFFYLFDSKGTPENNTISLPVIPELSVVTNELTLVLDDGNTFEANTFGIKDVSIPIWSAVRTEDLVTVSGVYDKVEMLLQTNDNPDAVMSWSFTDRPNDNYTLIFNSFELPSEFIDYAAMNNLDLSNLISTSRISIKQFASSKPYEYEELLFYPFLPSRPDDIYILTSNLTTN